MKDEEIEKGDCGPPTREFFFFFDILSDLNQSVPGHFADKSQMRYPVILDGLVVYRQMRYPVILDGPVVYPANAFSRYPGWFGGVPANALSRYPGWLGGVPD